MKAGLNELRQFVRAVVLEEKKKIKKGEVDISDEVQPKGFNKTKEFDYSQPMGMDNLLRKQGKSNAGPYTAETTTVDDAFKADNPVKELNKEAILRKIIGGVVQEEISKDPWGYLKEANTRKDINEAENVWSMAKQWYDEKSKNKEHKLRDIQLNTGEEWVNDNDKKDYPEGVKELEASKTKKK